MKRFLLLALLSPVFSFHSALAVTAPIGGGTFPLFAQVPDTEGSIIGLRLNPGWGYHKKVYGIDIGIVGNTTSSEFIGVSAAGIFNTNLGKAIVTGMQLAGVMNRNSGQTYIGGIQLALGFNSAGKSGKTSVYGVQMAGFANLGANKVYGLQFGLYNEAEAVYGVQIGLINKAKSLHGLQIGLANMAEKNGFSFFPLLNVGF